MLCISVCFCGYNKVNVALCVTNRDFYIYFKISLSLPFLDNATQKLVILWILKIKG